MPDKNKEGDWPSNKGRENVYVCDKCKGFTTTIDIDEGVTPFIIGCMAKLDFLGQPLCDGKAVSKLYPKGPRPPHIPPPILEWYRPTGEDYERLSLCNREHVDKGGLIPRRRPN